MFDSVNTRKLHAAGVREILGGDSAGDENRWLGMHSMLEFENMVANGFTTMEMVLAATRESAKALRLDDLGMVAPGKSADFVVLDANVLDNIANVRKIDRVFIRGRQVDRVGMRLRWQNEFRAKGQM